MSYFELKDNDVFINTIEAHPEYSFFVNNRKIYINKQPDVAGYRDAANTIFGGPAGSVSLFEYNIDRPLQERIYPFVVKSGQKQTFKTVSKTDFNTQYGYDGDVIYGTYDLFAGISTHYGLIGTDNEITKRMRALKTSLKHNEFWSHYFKFETYDNEYVTMVNIPSIFYGSSIKKGTVSLKIYVNGIVVGEVSDSSQRGELVNNNNKVVGTILYSEGIILLFDKTEIFYFGNNNQQHMFWNKFFYGLSSNQPFMADEQEISFSLDFKGVSQLQNMTILAKAPEGMLNHSNNPTYLEVEKNPFAQYHLSSHEYIEKQRFVKNTVYSEQTDVSPPFNKETYISKICIYDEHRRLIGVCKLATPIKKTEAREFLFKMKLDL